MDHLSPESKSFSNTILILNGLVKSISVVFFVDSLKTFHGEKYSNFSKKQLFGNCFVGMVMKLFYGKIIVFPEPKEY